MHVHFEHTVFPYVSIKTSLSLFPVKSPILCQWTMVERSWNRESIQAWSKTKHLLCCVENSNIFRESTLDWLNKVKKTYTQREGRWGIAHGALDRATALLELLPRLRGSWGNAVFWKIIYTSFSGLPVYVVLIAIVKLFRDSSEDSIQFLSSVYATGAFRSLLYNLSRMI